MAKIRIFVVVLSLVFSVSPLAPQEPTQKPAADD